MLKILQNFQYFIAIVYRFTELVAVVSWRPIGIIGVSKTFLKHWAYKHTALLTLLHYIYNRFLEILPERLLKIANIFIFKYFL